MDWAHNPDDPSCKCDSCNEALKEITELPAYELLEGTLKELAIPAPSIPVPIWRRFNEALGGFRPREFTIFVAPTGAGKTTFLANLSATLLEGRHKHFVMSVETGHYDYMKRVLSVFAGKDLNTGYAVPIPVLEHVMNHSGEYLKSDLLMLSLYENRVPVERLCDDLRRMEKAGCKVAMIDNLNFFLEVTSAADQYREMDRVIHELVILCKQIDMHVIMVMHPRKTDGERVTSVFDIRGSSLAVQEAHNVLVMNRPTSKEIQDGFRTSQDRELLFLKLRRRGMFVGRPSWFNFVGGRYLEVE